MKRPTSYWTYSFAAVAFILSFLSLPKLFSSTLLNGPMLSDLTYREAQIWTQSEKPATLAIHYYESKNPKQIFVTPKIQTTEANACIANFLLTKVEPNRNYTYSIEIDGVLSSEKYTFNSLNYYYQKAPPPDVKIAILGSHYAIDPEFEPPYRKLGGAYSIFKKVYETKPDLIIWSGNTAHLRNSDLDSQSGYFKRFTHARSSIEPKELMAKIPNLGIWSYNDYGVSGSGKEMQMKDLAQKAFSQFWPKTSSVKHHDALFYSHRISDVEFFFLDVQSQRNTNVSSYEEIKILGEEQIEWLKNGLLVSTANFKIIVSGAPILNPSKTDKNLSYAENEKQLLLDMLKSNKISGLFFISGGSYKGELTRLVHSTHYSFFDLTIGPSTAMPITEDKELNFYRIPGTNSFEHQYATLEIKGDEKDRLLKIGVFSLAGAELWSRTIKASELSVFE